MAVLIWKEVLSSLVTIWCVGGSFATIGLNGGDFAIAFGGVGRFEGGGRIGGIGVDAEYPFD